MTPGQSAVADGFAANIAQNGQVWTRTVDTAAITGVAGRLKKDDVRLAGTGDMDFPVFVADQVLAPTIPLTQCMPTNRLKRGDELTKPQSATVTKYFRVTRADYEESTGLWCVILSSSFAP